MSLKYPGFLFCGDISVCKIESFLYSNKPVCLSKKARLTAITCFFASYRLRYKKPILHGFEPQKRKQKIDKQLTKI